MNDRRPLGTGCDRADLSHARDAELPPAPRAQLAAEQLPTTVPAAEPKSRPTAGRRVLGAGPAAPDGDRGCDQHGDTGL